MRFRNMRVVMERKMPFDDRLKPVGIETEPEFRVSGPYKTVFKKASSPFRLLTEWISHG